ncbi:MAG: SIS domain-containing protein [Deltaproteobacteria bacterium]|nr:SIS domain-containing protein [Deltaproteobacteria bacterium]
MPQITLPNKPLSETEKAMDQQSGLLGLNWSERIPAKAAAALRGATSITFIGTGTSYNCGLWASWLCRLQSGGKIPSRAISAWDFLLGDYLTSVGKHELLVVISHRGNRSLTKKLLDAVAKHRHILISGEAAPTGKHPFIYTSPQEVSCAHTMSLISAMAAASEIIAALVPAKAAKSLRAEREMAAVLLQAVSDDTEELGEALGGIITRGAGLHWVGGGPFHAMALELALKAREIMHVPAHSYNAEEFLHGPLASVDEEDTLVLLQPFEGTREKPMARLLYHERLQSCRTAAEAVGVLVVAPSWAKPISTAAAKLNLAWQALLPLYWGQVLCVATAKLWNLNPDLNRRDDPRYEEARLRSEL